MEHGIEIWVDGKWVYVPAKNREEADKLQASSTTVNPQVQSRRVSVTAEGFHVLVNTTA